MRRSAQLVNYVLVAASGMQWQPIATAPKDGTEVLLTDGHWTRTGYWAKRIETWSVDTAVSLKPPTYWARLPAPPADVCAILEKEIEDEEKM